MKQLKRILLFSIFCIVAGMGASLTLKAAVGVLAWDALAQSTSYLLGLKVGTISMILNCSCILGQWLLLKKDFNFSHLLQLPVVILIGMVINFVFYDLLGSVVIDSYTTRLILLVAAFTLLAFALAVVLVLDVVTFPLEGLCMALCKKTKWNFSVVRQSADILSILLVLLLTFSLSLPLTLREGTILGMLFFAPLVGYFMKIVHPVFSKLDLVNEETVN